MNNPRRIGGCLNRKGQLHVPFQWVFVLIGGAVILAFLLGFAIKYRDLQENKGDVELLTSLDVALTKLQSSYFPTKTEITVSSDFQTGCDDASVKIKVGGKEYATENLIFSSGLMKGKISVWYVPYKMPFKIANFYYLLPKSRKIYILSDAYGDTLADEVYEELKENFEGVVRVEAESEAVDGRVAYFARSAPRSIKEGWVVIVPGENKYEGEIVESKGGKNEKSRYIGIQMVYGAIFSENYNCLASKVMERTKIISEVYANKAKIIQKGKGGCGYPGFAINLTDFGAEPSYGKAQELEKLNKNIGGRCLPLF
jgi:hypothetical protein